MLRTPFRRNKNGNPGFNLTYLIYSDLHLQQVVCAVKVTFAEAGPEQKGEVYEFKQVYENQERKRNRGCA